MTLENSENPAEPNQPTEHRDSETADHSHETKCPTPPIAAPSTTPPCCKHPEITCNIKRDRIDKATLWLEGVGLFILFVYTIATVVYASITNNMWKEMQKQTLLQTMIYRPSISLNLLKCHHANQTTTVMVVVGVQNDGNMDAQNITIAAGHGFGPPAKGEYDKLTDFLHVNNAILRPSKDLPREKIPTSGVVVNFSIDPKDYSSYKDRRLSLLKT